MTFWWNLGHVFHHICFGNLNMNRRHSGGPINTSPTHHKGALKSFQTLNPTIWERRGKVGLGFDSNCFLSMIPELEKLKSVFFSCWFYFRSCEFICEPKSSDTLSSNQLTGLDNKEKGNKQSPNDETLTLVSDAVECLFVCTEKWQTNICILNNRKQ